MDTVRCVLCTRYVDVGSRLWLILHAKALCGLTSPSQLFADDPPNSRRPTPCLARLSWVAMEFIDRDRLVESWDKQALLSWPIFLGCPPLSDSDYVVMVPRWTRCPCDIPGMPGGGVLVHRHQAGLLRIVYYYYHVKRHGSRDPGSHWRSQQSFR